MNSNENKYKTIVLQMIVENQKHMFNTNNINDIYYFTNVDIILKEIFAKMFNYDLNIKEYKEMLNWEIENFKKGNSLKNHSQMAPHCNISMPCTLDLF